MFAWFLIPIIVVAVPELVCCLIYLRRYRKLPYTDKPQSTNSLDELSAQICKDADFYQKILICHPLLGYVYRKGVTVSEVLGNRLDLMCGDDSSRSWQTLEADADGFFTIDKPNCTPSSEGVCRVAVLGGSQAQWMSLASKQAFLDGLKKSGLAAKNLELVNLSVGGAKQPQQVNALVASLAKGHQYDAVVDLDGFNELELNRWNASNDLSMTMPIGWVIDRIRYAPQKASRTDFDLLQRAIADYQSVKRLEKRSATLPLAIVRLGGRIAMDRLIPKLTEECKELSESVGQLEEIVAVDELGHEQKPEPATIEDCCEIWATGSRLLHSICKSRNISYLHVLRPCLYFTGKVITEWEKEACNYSAESKLARFMQKGYPVLQERGRTLADAGINFWDASGLYDEFDGDVFCEPTGHLTQTGMDMLAAHIGERLGACIEKEQL